MGQSNSNYSIKPEKILKTNELTNYMEWTNFKNLKEGEKYKLIFESVEFELIFMHIVVNMVIVKIVMQYLQTTKCVIQQIKCLNIINLYQKKNMNQK